MKNILIVDNDQSTLEIMKKILNGAGYDTQSCATYQEMLPLLYQNHFDIIILDIMLDNQDGRIICQQLKQNPRTRDIYIIIFSGFPEKLENYQDFGADARLDKPFNLQSFLLKIDRIN